MAGFTSCFLKICKHHHATSFCQWYLPFSIQSGQYVLPLFSTPFSFWSPTPSSRHFKIKRSSQNVTIIPSQNIPYHRNPLALACPFKVSIKLSKLISSWLLLFSINLTPHIALMIAFSDHLKIAVSFSRRHHVSLPCNIADRTQL